MEEVKFFFSYAREDSEFVLQLAKELRAVGANLWLDQLDIFGGQRWDHAVEGALATCQGMIAVLSPESVASHNVMDEVSYALEEGKLVVPILLRSCTIPFRLRRVHYIDFTADYETGFSSLLRALRIDPPSQLAEEPLEETPLEAESEAPRVQITPPPAQARLLRRRVVLGVSLLASLGVLTGTIIKLFPGLRRWLFPNPRFVRKSQAKPYTASLSSGFYRNPKSNIVHYVWPNQLIRKVHYINERRLESWQGEAFKDLKFNGEKGHLQLASASSSFENAAGTLIRAKKPLQAIELLRTALIHDIQLHKRSGKKPSLRLYDLFTGLSVRYEQLENIRYVIDLVSETGQEKLFSGRITKWKDEKSRWYRGWTDRKNGKRWAGLPM